MPERLYKPFSALLLLVLLAGCASHPDETPELTEAQHYKKAHKSLQDKKYVTAIDQLNELEARFPYGTYADQAQLDLIYAHFRAQDYPETAAAADHYINNHPTGKGLDYAYYFKGLANWYMNTGPLEKLIPEDESARDLSSMKDAFHAFNKLVSQYPDSPYAPDARSRMVYIRNLLAAHEIHVARYYARRRAFVAAADRANYVVEHFQGTPSTAEALAILTKSYGALGQQKLAGKSLKVLAANYPDSRYLDKQGKVTISWWPRPEGKSLLSLLTFDLL